MFGNSKPIWNRHQLISTHSPERRLIFYLHAVYAVFCSNLYNVDKTWEWMLWHALTFPRTWSVSTVDMQWLRCAKMVRWSPGDTVHMVETAEMSRLDFVQTILSVLHDSYMTLTCLPDLTVPCQFCCGHETMVKQCTVLTLTKRACPNSGLTSWRLYTNCTILYKSNLICYNTICFGDCTRFCMNEYNGGIVFCERGNVSVIFIHVCRVHSGENSIWRSLATY